MTLREELERVGRSAKAAARRLATLPTDVKNRALAAMAQALVARRTAILAANAEDLAAARRRGIRGALLDRLTLNADRITEMAEGLRGIAELPDPVGETIRMWRRPNGLWIGKRRVPIGVIGIIYEARPNVTSDCIGLCLKAGNSVILRGGSEAIHSNRAIFDVLRAAAAPVGVPDGAFQVVGRTERSAVTRLLQMTEYLDLVIPRGGEALIREVVRSSKVPVIKQFKGVCHVFVDRAADLDKATAIVLNAKVQRPGVCNAMETLLVHRAVAKRFLPAIAQRLQQHHVELRGCPQTRAIVRGVKRATERDWAEEYLDLILSVRVVSDLDAAIDHIDRYGTMHSEAIVTEDYDAAMAFAERVDAACVYVNASTRFTDGGQFGMGAEIGVSTDRLHARGPMGLEELTTYKYVIFGSGQVRT